MSVNKKELTESELLEKAGQELISKFNTRGHRNDHFGTTKESTINKDLWLDTDFFFSVVFQSKKQKYDFLEAVEKFLKEKGIQLQIDEGYGYPVQIINGYILARQFGIDLKEEISREYPLGDKRLKTLALDTEKL